MIEICTDRVCGAAGAKALCEAAGEDATTMTCPGRCELAPVVWSADGLPVGHATVDAVKALLDGRLSPDPEGPRAPRAWAVMDELPDGPDFEPDEALAAFDAAGLLVDGAPLGAALRAFAARPEPRLVAVRVRPDGAGVIAPRVLTEELPELVVEGLALAAMCGDAAGALAWCSPRWPLARQALERTLARYGEAFPVPLDLMELAALPTPIGTSPPLLVLEPATLIAAATVFRRGAGWWTANAVTWVGVTGAVVTPGVVEVPLRAPLREVIAAAGGPNGPVSTYTLTDGPLELGADALDLPLAAAASRAGATRTDALELR